MPDTPEDDPMNRLLAIMAKLRDHDCAAHVMEKPFSIEALAKVVLRMLKAL